MDLGDLIFFIIFVIIIISNIVKQVKKAGTLPSEKEASGNKAQKKSGWKNVLEEMLEEARKQMEEKSGQESAGEPLRQSTGWEDIIPDKTPPKKELKKPHEFRKRKEHHKAPLIRETADRPSATFKPECMRCNASMKEIADLGIDNQSGLIYCDSCGEQHKYRVVNGELTLKRTNAMRQKHVIAQERRFGKSAARSDAGRRMPDTPPVTEPWGDFGGVSEIGIQHRLSREGLQNAVVWSEILGKPLALKEMEIQVG